MKRNSGIAFLTITLLSLMVTACDESEKSEAIVGCSFDSYGTADTDGVNLIYSAPCGSYGEINAWSAYASFDQLPVSGQAVNAEVKYMLHTPESDAKALVVLLAGGNGETGISGNMQTREVLTSGRNFLVRSAQIFTDKAYLAVTIDRPSVTVDLVNAFGSGAYDMYRLSQFHALDLVTVINEVNTDNLDVFFAGTSRGAISAFAQQRLAQAISLSSPVTSGNRLHLGYLEDPDNYPSLQSNFATVPIHILANSQDSCAVSSRDNALMFSDAITSTTNINTVFDDNFGGDNGLGDLTSNPCNARTYHGFLGIENAAVGKISTWMDDVLSTLDSSNHRPTVSDVTVTVNMGVSTTMNIDLASLVSDIDPGETLSFETWGNRSIYGASVELNGSMVTYTLPDSVNQNYQDSFVYIVYDDNGGENIGGKHEFGKVVVNVEL